MRSRGYSVLTVVENGALQAGRQDRSSSRSILNPRASADQVVRRLPLQGVGSTVAPAASASGPLRSLRRGGRAGCPNAAQPEL